MERAKIVKRMRMNTHTDRVDDFRWALVPTCGEVSEGSSDCFYVYPSSWATFRMAASRVNPFLMYSSIAPSNFCSPVVP